MELVRTVTSDNLSFYRTSHIFENYGEFETIDQFREYCHWAKEKNCNIYILGNGSNTLFVHKKIKSLILKNKLPKTINVISENRLEVYSSVLVIDILKYCHKNSLNSFYYLASVPATIGGALAMNAGRGRRHGLTIYDFVESVVVFDFENSCLKTLNKKEIVKGYRETIFTGSQSCLILSATFRFNPVTLESNPIAERCKWSKKAQDYSAPNCGSVFKVADSRILKRLKGLWIGGHAGFSAKTTNWILNKSTNSNSILILIAIAKLLHILLRKKKAELEIITVD